MGIRFRCKNCNQKYELEDQWAGQVSECLRCGAAMQVPRESQIPPEKTAAPKSKTIRRAMPVQGINVLDKIQKVQIVSATTKSGAEDDIIFRCKICQQKYRLPRDLAGQVAECAKCKRNMVVPVKSDDWAKDTEKPDDDIVFWCKACGVKYRLDKELVGQRVECTRCKSTFPVPKESETGPPKNLVGQKPVNNKQAVTAPATSANDKIMSIAPVNNSTAIPELPKETPESRLDRIPAKTAPPVLEKEKTAAAANIAGNKGEKKSDSGNVLHIDPEMEKTHTTIEMTKTVTLMVKYIIKLPRNNILFSWGSVVIDWLAQFGIFRWIPKRIFAYIFILAALTGMLYLTSGFFRTKDDPPTYQLHTICAQCSNREIRNIIDPDDAVCSKCKSKIGYAWQCEECGKYFPKLNTEKTIINDPKLSRHEKIGLIKPTVCPHCRSSKVHYVTSDDATFGY
ncbi:MAG: hypothetical protein WCV67_01570 [Victivallaceae bacterium]|jgi:hypothetical protein